MTTLKKLKIGRASNITIIKEDGGIDYQQWVDFINEHPDMFIWYEDTEDGKKVKASIHKFQDWAQEKILYSLNRTNVYSTKKMCKASDDCVQCFDKEYNSIYIQPLRKISKPAAEILLEMARVLGAKIMLSPRKEFYSMEQLE